MPILRLVTPAVSADTVEALEYLLGEARAGRVIGIAWVTIGPAKTVTVDAAGAARTSPTFARGGVCMLNDELGKLL